ncbi:MAG: hypothetical protein D6702_08185 [Planctomycetota bacterium]|nr:MAG: hypothetical protein D6702_08185 [Planctomycetota bacterium]
MRTFLLSCVVLLLLAAGWWVLRSAGQASGSATGGIAAEAPARPDEAGAAERPGDPRPRTAAGAAAETEATRTSLGGPGDDLGFAAPSEEPDAIRVRVLAPDGETPVVGAEVIAIDGAEADQRKAMLALRRGQTVPEILRRLGVRYRTGADGTVRVRAFPSGAVFAALDRKGIRLVIEEEPGPEVELVLQPRTRVEAQVFGPDGRPVAEVPVGLVVGVGGWEQTLMTRTTEGRDGIARFEDFLPVLSLDPLPTVRAELGLDLPLSEPVRESFAPAEPPAEPVLLLLPETGSVVVEVRDLEGDPVPDGTEVFLGIAPEEEDGAGPPLPPWMRTPSNPSVAETRHGEARFPFVGLGLRLRAGARPAFWPRPLIVDATGPEAPGQTVRIRLEPDTSRPILVFRALDEEDRPLAETKLTIIHHLEDGPRSAQDWTEATTGADGRFLYPLPESPASADARRFLEIGIRPSIGPGWVAQTRVDLALSYPPGPVEMGEVRLLPLPFLAGGIVLGPDDRPVEGATVRPAWKEVYGPEPAQFYWDEDWRLTVQTGPDGTFVVRGRPDDRGRELALAVSAAGLIGTTVPVVPGSDGVLVRLAAGCGLSGRLLSDPEVELPQLDLRLSRELEEGQTSYSTSHADEDGRFSFEGLEPGRYRFEIVPNRDEDPVFVADDVLLAPGENQDPRLDPVDLRGRLRSIHLLVEDPEEEPVPSGSITGIGEDSRLWLQFRNGEAVLFTGRPSLDVRIQASGFQAVELHGLARDRTVRLRPAALVHFVLAEPIPLPPSMWLAVNLVSVDGRDRWLGPGQHRFNRRGEARLPAPGNGRYRVVIELSRQNGESSYTTHQLPAESVRPGEIEILDAGVEQTFPIEVDRAAIEEVMKRWSG